jgi:type VI secretion system protein ImpJ
MWRSKVLWSEGLFLRPQHLQQQERWFERLVAQRLDAARPFGWGFTTLSIDAPALAAGTLALGAASGVLPDGTVFRFPADDRPPDPLRCDPGWKNALLYLAVASERPGVPSCTLDEEGAATGYRYRALVGEIVDVNDGFPEPVPVQVGGLCLRLLPAAELTGALAAMPVARLVERRADGQLVLDTGFVAPTLSCRDSALAGSWIDELRGLLHQRSEALATRLAHPGRGGVAEIADFLLLQTVNRYASLLDHLATVDRLHPERFYAECVQMAGDLATFGDDRRLARPFPAYDHDDLQATFRPVLDQLRRALSMVLEQHAVPIELHDRKYGVRVAVIADKQLLSNAAFVLAVNAQMPAEALRLRFPTQTKIGPVEKIRDLVNLQLPGVGLRALPVAPRQIPYHAGFNYFELDTASELWRTLQQSGGLAMHVAGEFPGLELELWAVRD